MKNLLLRSATFVVVVPLLFVVIVFLPHANHLALSVLAVVVSGVAATEIYQIMADRIGRNLYQRIAAPVMGMVLPALALLQVQGVIGEPIILAGVAAVSALVLAAQTFRREEENFDKVLPSLSGNFLLLLYPGLFVSYVVRMGGLPDSEVLIVTFLAAVYFNDTAAYLAGVAFGKYSPNPFPISPNKSVVGFLGGFILSPLVVWIASLLYPGVFDAGLWTILGFGAAIGLATILGDLAESALKRGVTVKDSGSLIPGRGGLLDSIDSVLLSAPVFFYLYAMLF